MPTFRTPSAKVPPGAQRNQNFILTDVVTFTGTTTVDLKRYIKGKGVNSSNNTYQPFHVMALNFEDAGGAATVHRLASVNNNDGTFTINASKATGVAGVYAAATASCKVRWSVLPIS